MNNDFFIFFLIYGGIFLYFIIKLQNYAAVFKIKHYKDINVALVALMHISDVKEEDISELLKKGADINFRAGAPLIEAIKEKRKINILDYLIKNGANIKYHSPDVPSPLLWAIIYNHPQAFNLFVQNGAELSYKIKDGSDLLLCAVVANHHSMVKLLIENYGYDINVTNDDGITPLMAACKTNRLKFFTLKYLLKKKPNLSAKDKFGKTAENYFNENKWLRFWRFLRLV